MAGTKYVSSENLTRYNDKVKETYVKKEHKTGSESAYKVLSDNNLTDELLQKIQNAGDSTFSGNYPDLIDKPAIDGTTLTKDSTAAGLGIAKLTDLPTAATAEKAGIVKVDGETITAKADGTISAVQPDVSGFVTKTDADNTYAKKTDTPSVATSSTAGIVKPDNETITVDGEGTIKAELDDYAKTAEVESKLEPYAKTADVEKELEDYVTDTELETTLADYSDTNTVNGLISSAIDTVKQENQGAIHTKGNIAFASLPQPTESIWGDMYNVTDAFQTDARFNGEAGLAYPANTEVYVIKNGEGNFKWDIYFGYVDMSKYALKADQPQPMTQGEVDALFSE